ncbi:PREDICTED: probable multidrug resistance-associated protein lethal(2)03659 [Nicrophorus vespilloides]|uniref:Probable multidrug resistance-associated protein lethal(2)03659 n=1 Tax=Nicrophorus vespilloides TaxID=110193 RepID=A0ABM1MTK5_NICVS|nr:PREDICTED: probable multidrug resistance-associated protein lethal(2)03659 [Nicrophorus vespilloides]
MDSSKKYDNVSPEVSSGFLSKLLFCWILPFFKIGLKRNLEVKDLFNTTRADLSEQLGNILERNWDNELKRAKEDKKRPSLMRALSKTFIRHYAVYGVIIFIESIILKLIHPLVLAELIKYFEPNTIYTNLHGWLFAAGVVFISFLNILIMHQAGLGCYRIGMRCRIASCSIIYRKLLRLNKTSLSQTAAGQVINLMSNDVQRFEMVAIFLHYIWIMPIQAVVAGIIMYKGVGYAAVIGILSIALQAIPLQGYLSRLQGKYRSQIATRTDHRVKLMSEITAGIQVIKMYAWEKPFEKVVQLARKLEIDVITKKSYILGFMTALMVFTERTSLYLMVVIYALTGNSLTSDLVFSNAQFFNTIQLYMAIFFPLAIATYSEAKVSIKRIEDFLLLAENPRHYVISEVSVEKGCIKISKGKASWIPNPIIDTLTNINLEIKPGTLCAVVGSVGAGKSSLLQLLLKELPLSSGKLDIAGNVSYASQEPWLFVSSVKNNILFGQPFTKTKYKEIVKVCALETDFQQFPYGDKTLVGERGVSLSGGQRARINLARAVYRDADIYLFDDPLSAVDTHVGKHLFEECIVKYLENKTRLLVTHQLQFLKKADQIIIINNGQITKVGTYEELAENELAHLERESSTEETNENPKERKRLMSITSEASTVEDEEHEEPQETQELMEKGSIPTSTYWQYFRAGANVLALFVLAFLIIIAQMFCNWSDLWLRYWTTEEEVLCAKQYNSKNDSSIYTTTEFYMNETETEISTNAFPINDTVYEEGSCDFGNFPRKNYILIYSVLILLTVVLTIVRSLAFYKVCMNSSKSLHNNMFGNILEATMRFFDTNPSGRILNRFSKDIGAVDEILPRCMLDSIQIFMVMFGILIMVFIVSPIMILPTIVLAALFVGIRYVYMSTAQDLKRLEGITRAPVFSHVSASLSGLTTIRSSGAQYIITKEFDALQDQHTASFVMMIVASETFGFYLDLISVLFVGIVTFQFFAYDESSVVGGDVGLVLSQSLILTGMLQHGMRQTTEVANNMTSVERVLQYTKLDKEGPFESVKKPHRDWPEKGAIIFKNLFLQYAPSEPPVLKNLNVEILPGDKVGIVGRTGAGKSSLISAIFRLAPIEGSITIDEVDTKEIGLNDLRSNISIIPQEPVLFSTTVRNNLDPFDKCNDDTLWKALENVELKDNIDKLEQEVNEGGSNFSAGQRQLMCLARAIIRNNKIIIMDEATANVDQQTDALIQKTIRKNFLSCTVLTIAHRLNTIMDSDKVLVMDAGQAVEFGHPHELLQDSNGIFHGMLKQTGRSMEQELKNIAREAYESKQISTKPNEQIIAATTNATEEDKKDDNLHNND